MKCIRAPPVRARDRDVLVAAEVADPRRFLNVEATAHSVHRLFARLTALPRVVHIGRDDGVPVDPRNEVARQVDRMRLRNLRVVGEGKARAHRRAGVVGRRRRVVVRKDVLPSVRANVTARVASDHVPMARECTCQSNPSRRPRLQPRSIGSAPRAAADAAVGLSVIAASDGMVGLGGGGAPGG